MSRSTNPWGKIAAGVLGLAWVVSAAGCGGGGGEGTASPKADASREGKIAKDRQRELEMKKKLETVQMPAELARTWFYDEDSSLTLLAEWRAEEGKVRLAVGQSLGKGKPAKAGEGLKLILGFYAAESPRGPFKLVERTIGSEATLEAQVRLNEVKDRWYKAVSFSDAGAATAYTTPVQLTVVDARRGPSAAPPPRKPVKPAPAKKETAKKDAAAKVEPKSEEPQTEPEKSAVRPMVVVMPLTNALEKEKLDRQYLGRGLCELLREFLGQRPDVMTPDPGYADAVLARLQGSRAILTPATLGLAGTTLRANIVLTGTFTVTDEGLKVDLSFINVSTGAVRTSRPATRENPSADEIGRELAGELARGLGLEFDEAATGKFSLMWKALNERRGYIEKAMRMHADGKHLEALGAFEAVKPTEVMDAQVLEAMSETYADRGQFLQAARLAALATDTPGWRPTLDYWDRMGRLLRAARDLKGSLDVLARFGGRETPEAWKAAMDLLAGSFSVSGTSAKAVEQRKDWPVVRPQWEATSPNVLINPTIGGDALIVFGSLDKDFVQNFGPTSTPARRLALRTGYADPAICQTAVYSLATGELKWQKMGLMSAAATPAVSDGVIFGIGATGPVAASLKNGEIAWQDAKGPLALPAAVNGAEDFGRPGWKTYEVARVGTHLIAWLPKDTEVHVWNAADGKYVGPVFHGPSWGPAGQFFMKQPDGLYFLTRGGAQPTKLTDELLSNPTELTSKMRMVADPEAALQNDLVIETTRTVATSDTSRYDYVVVGSDAKKGEFEWLYPVLSREAPVIVDGKLFLYKQDISGQQSTRIQRIDVSKQETDLLNLSSLEISLYEPTLALPDGKGVLVGSQAAISADGKLLWVNRSLPVTQEARVIGKYLLIPPLLVDPATGKVAMEIEAPPGFRWNTGTLASGQNRLVLIKTDFVRKGNENVIESRIWTYDLGAGATPEAARPAEAAPAAEKPKEEPKLTVAAAEKAFMDSEIVAPPGAPMTDLYRSLADQTYNSTGDPSKAADFLLDALKARPRNGDHLVRLLGFLKPYAAMAGDYDRFLAACEDIRKDYPKSPDLLASLTAEEKAAQSEKAQGAQAREYFQTAKLAAHDPLLDWPSEYLPGGLGNMGRSASPSFNIGWTKKPFKTGSDDRIMPVDPAVLVLLSSAHALVALRHDDGSKMWEMPDVYNAVYYRGIVYTLGEELRAVTPTTGLTLWRKRVDAATAANIPLAAGQDLIFYALPDEIVACDWATGREVWRVAEPGRERLDVHGTVLAASTRQGKLVVLDAKTGGRLGAKDVGTYTLYDGKIYSCEVTRDPKRLELTVVVYEATTLREQWRKPYDLPTSKRAPEMLPPAATWEHLFIVCDLNLVQLKRSDGEVIAKQTLGGTVARPLTASPSLIYLVSSEKKLVGYEVGASLARTLDLPASPIATAVASEGTLYLLDTGELKALRGQKEDFSAEHLKALTTPSEEPATATVERKEDIRVTKSRFVSIGSIRGRKELPDKLDDKRLGSLAFIQLVNVGRMSDWKLMIDESLKDLTPGERKTRALTEPERRMLFSEMVQRRESAAQEVLREALKSNNRITTLMVLDAMTTGDRAVYGPLLVKVFKDAMDEGQFLTSMFCADAVGKWKYEPAVPLLVTGLDNAKSAEGLRASCAKALAEFDRPEALRALLKTAQEDSRTALPRQCTDLLVRQGSEGVKAVAGMLASPSAAESSRLNAATALGPVRSPEATAALLAALKPVKASYPLKVRATAAAALAPAAKDSDDVLNALVSVMTDAKADPLLRNACLAGLGLSDNPKAIPHLIDAMGDKDVDNRRFSGTAAYQYVQRVTKETRIGPYPDQWQAWWEKNKTRFGAKTP